MIVGIRIWAQRLSYVGELGYELYVKVSEAKKIYELLIEKGKDFNLSNWYACDGYYAYGKWFYIGDMIFHLKKPISSWFIIYDK